MALLLSGNQRSITSLPENLVLDIFKYLSVKDLCTIGRVCRSWRRIVKDNSLWRHVNLTPYKLNLHRMWKVIRSHFSEVLLSLQLSGYLDGESTNPKKSSLSDAMLKDLCQRCPNITYLKIINTNFTVVSAENLPGSLERIAFNRCMIPPGWLRTVVRPSGTLGNLKCLDLSSSTRTCNEDLKDISQLTNLTSLKLSGCYRLTEAGLKAICETLTNLEVLDISETHPTALVFHVMCRNLKKLHTLKLSACKTINSADIATIASTLTNLKELNLSYCTQIDDKVVEPLKSLKTLQCLDLTGTTIAGKEKDIIL